MMTPAEREKHLIAIVKKKKTNNGIHSKWTDDEKMVRRDFIYYWYGKGKSDAQMGKLIVETLGCNYTTARSYIRDANEYLAELSKENIQTYREKMIEKLEQLAEEALATRDRKTALACYDQISKLNGAYTQKIEADLKGDIKFEFGGE